MWGSRKRKAARAARTREGENAGLPEESWFSALEGATDLAPVTLPISGRWNVPNPVLRPLATWPRGRRWAWRSCWPSP